jgi:hypothetical protein
MQTFKEIRERIEKETIEGRPTEQLAQVEDVDGKTIVRPSFLGTVVASPGTEWIQFDAQDFYLMFCYANMAQKKKRYCFVEKHGKATMGAQFVTSKGERVHIMSKESYETLLNAMQNVTKQVQAMRQEHKLLVEQRDLYKNTIDTLRRNGVID